MRAVGPVMTIMETTMSTTSLSTTSNSSLHRRRSPGSSRRVHEEFDIDALAWQRPSLRRARDARVNKANACWNTDDLAKIVAGNAPRNKSLSPIRNNNLNSSSSNPKVLLHSVAAIKQKRKQQSHSHRLWAMLQSDLRLVPAVGNSPNNNTKSNKHSLADFQPDIDSLLSRLQSTDFVGQIDPKFHAQYLPTSQTMPSF
jgi:hypothetical protein